MLDCASKANPAARVVIVPDVIGDEKRSKNRCALPECEGSTNRVKATFVTSRTPTYDADGWFCELYVIVD